jgi:hypothetical protein
MEKGDSIMKSLLTVALFALTLTVSAKAEANSCTALMKNGRGLTVDTFNARGYDRQDACQQAKRQCDRAIYNGRRGGRNLYCEVARNGGGGYGQQVVRRCSSELVGPRGRTIQFFQAQARGQARTGIKQQACRKALRKCNRMKNEQGYYRARCVSQRGGMSNPPVNPPRRGGRNGRVRNY